MKISKNSVVLYALGLALSGAALWEILSMGAKLQVGAAAPSAAAAPLHGGLSPLCLLLLQALVIIAVTRLCASAIQRFRQPAVIGEVIGGILLGPSALGLLWPAAGAFLFPPASLASLGFLSQIGLILFMFVVGMELNSDVLKKEARAAVLISHASILVPFLLGSWLALSLYKGYAPEGAPFLPFCLFMGIAMSITAFPVLARIIQERRLSGSPLGTLALTCAAVDDLTAWCALAVVVGVSRQGTIRGSLGMTGLCVLYIAAMLLVVRPALGRWLENRPAESLLGKGTMAAALLVMLASALATEAIGIHALFGAFLAGIVMPQEAAFRQGLAHRLEDFSTVILLPLFFALSGLRTHLGLLDSPAAWAACGLIILVAVAGKLGGSSLVARWAGTPWRESLAIGALMNARGLVELVVLNIGYDLKIISPEIFTMMVVMALATTLMTGPLLELFVPDLLRAAARLDPARAKRENLPS